MLFISKPEAIATEGEINNSFYYSLDSSDSAIEGAVELVGDYLAGLCLLNASNGVTILVDFY
jgi:hypothetical protein